MNLTQAPQKPVPPFSFFKRLGYLALGIRKEVLIVYGMFALVCSISILLFDKCLMHRSINQWHAPFFDFFFKYSTHLGDGALFGVLVIIFAFLKRRMILVWLLSGILTFLVTFLFKKILFHGSYRPAMDVGIDSLHWVEGVKVALWGTFPSGHTITVFAIATVLCLYCRNSKLQYVWIALALIVGYSRVYLSLHFLVDVFVGSLFGILIGLISMTAFYNILFKNSAKD